VACLYKPYTVSLDSLGTGLVAVNVFTDAAAALKRASRSLIFRRFHNQYPLRLLTRAVEGDETREWMEGLGLGRGRKGKVLLCKGVHFVL
jgi:hypothetical protein